jgi:hypothetical protein
MGGSCSKTSCVRTFGGAGGTVDRGHHYDDRTTWASDCHGVCDTQRDERLAHADLVAQNYARLVA